MFLSREQEGRIDEGGREEGRKEMEGKEEGRRRRVRGGREGEGSKLNLDGWGHSKAVSEGRTFWRAVVSKWGGCMMNLRKCVNCHSLGLYVWGAKAGWGDGSRCLGEQSRRGYILRCEGEGWEGWISAHKEDNHPGWQPFHYCLCEGQMGLEKVGTWKVCSSPFQLKVLDPDFHMWLRYG